MVAFAAGVLVTLVALGAVGYLVLADQRRSARLLAAALSRALAREVRIDRVSELGPGRVVMRGVRLLPTAGWPVEVAAEQVEATGPLLAAAAGGAAPVALVVRRPTVALPAGGAGVDLAALETARAGLAAFLAGSLLLDVTATGGLLPGSEGTGEWDLVLRKRPSGATAELVLREPGGGPLTVTAQARMDGQTVRVDVTGRGRLAPAARWFPPAVTAVAGEPFSLRLEVGLAPSGSASARVGLTLGDVVAVEGDAEVREGTLHATLSRAEADLGVATAALGWRPVGRVVVDHAELRWRPQDGPVPHVDATWRVASLALPAAAAGTDVAAAGAGGRLVVETIANGFAAHGEVLIEHLRAAGLQAGPVRARYRVAGAADGRLTRVDLDELVATIEGAVIRGGAGYDLATQRVEARLRGEDVQAAGLLRRLRPGWLGDTDTLRLTGLGLAADLDPRDLRPGALEVSARTVALGRPDGRLTAGPLTLRAALAPGRASVSVEAAGVTGALPAFRGAVARLDASAEVDRAAGFSLREGRLAARDGEGREVLTAEARPGPAERLHLVAHAPALDRLGGLWPDVARRVTGSADLDVELAGPGLASADGRLTLRVPEVEVLNGKVSMRDVTGELPVRRGAAAAGEPTWGRLEVGELIGYGLVVRDVTTPARIWQDRLSLNDLRYALYSGDGRGWAELELEPAGPFVRAQLTGEGFRLDEFVSAYGIRGGTITGLLAFDLEAQYRAGRLALNGRFAVPAGGTVNIELLNRLLAYAESDPSGVVRAALENLRAFDYKSAVADAHSAAGDVRVSLTLEGRERFGIFPPRVRAINVRNLPLAFLARQFPGH